MVYFESKSNRYKCCCNRCPATTGAWIILAVELVLLGINLFAYVLGDKDGSGIISGLFGMVVGIVICLLTAFALVKQRPTLLIPHMVFQVLVIIGLTAAGCAYIYAISVYVKKDYVEKIQHEDHGEMTAEQFKLAQIRYSLLLGGCYLICVGLQLWFLTVFVGVYRFFVEKSAYLQLNSNNKVDT